MARDQVYRCTIKYIEPLYWLGVVLGVVPPYNFNHAIRQRKKSNKFYASFAILILLTGYVCSTIGRIRDSYPSFSTFTLTVTDLALNVILTITNLSSIIVPSYFISATLKFLNLFSRIDHVCETYNKVIEKKAQRAMFVQLSIGHLLIMILFFWDGYVWISKTGWIQFRGYIFRDVQNYYSYVTVMIMYNFTCILRIRFKSLNKALEATNISNVFWDEVKIVGESCLKVLPEMRSTHKLRFLAQQYEMLLEQVSTFNVIFGWQILFTTATIVVGLLNTLDILMAYGYLENSKSVQYELIILSALWSTLQLVSYLLVIDEEEIMLDDFFLKLTRFII